MTLPGFMRAKQEEMERSLRKYREGLDHAPLKGQAAEGNWTQFFEDHLAKRYAVATGKAIDWRGETSGQLDIILHDSQYSPLVFNESGITYVPAESVYVVFDSKPEWSKATLLDTADKVESVRLLDRKSGPVYTINGLDVRKSVEKQPILGGILCHGSSWTTGAEETLRATLAGLVGDRVVDFGVGVRSGGFEVSENGQVATWGPEHALSGFWVTLQRRLQKLGTALAIDWDYWGRGSLPSSGPPGST